MNLIPIYTITWPSIINLLFCSFTNVGINHFDLIFPDGATPPREVLLKFLAISEMAPAAIAVHCKVNLKWVC